MSQRQVIEGLYAVRWTEKNGRTAEFHYGNKEAAELAASNFRRGWRKDARVERVTERGGKPLDN